MVRSMSGLFETLRANLRRSSIYPILENIRAWIDLAQWYVKRCPVPPPHFYKQQVIKFYAKKYKINTLVETGTYTGAMVHALREIFTSIISVELDSKLAQAAKQRFADQTHIRIIQGDSAQVLPKIIKDLKEPALFWLDGHYSAGVTARGKKDTPIEEELEIIAKHRIANHIVLIDDSRCFTGMNGYPKRSQLQKLMHNHMFSDGNDIIRLIPCYCA